MHQQYDIVWYLGLSENGDKPQIRSNFYHNLEILTIHQWNGLPGATQFSSYRS